MDFKVKRIGSSQAKNPVVRFWNNHFTPKKTVILCGLILFGGVALGGTIWIQEGGLKRSVERVVNNLPLKQDEYGHINILFLGVAGRNEEGGNLSDSLMLASINPKTPSVSLLSFPRDLYTSSEVGERKVNEIYAAARYQHGDKRGLEIVEEAISKFAGIEVHYSAVINFEIFEEAVDALGGIKIFVPEDIVDPNYPDENYGFQTFVIRKGNQLMDGETALKYARSRKTTSDYSRAKRQQDVLMAMRAQAAELNLFTDVSKIKSMYEIYKDNVNTDIGLTEALALAKIGTAIDYDHLVTGVLNDDPLQKGGFLYAPAREFYNGQFVLLPESWRDTREFIRLMLLTPGIYKENAQISILNGSKINGLAGEMATRLRRFGFHVIDTGNYGDDTSPVFASFFRVTSDRDMPLTTSFMTQFLGFSQEITTEEAGQISETDEPLEDIIDIEMVIGATQE